MLELTEKVKKRKLGQGDDQGELEGLDQGETLLHQQRWNPDEGPVVGQVDAEPHQPERQGAAPQLLGEQSEPGRLDRLPRCFAACSAVSIVGPS